MQSGNVVRVEPPIATLTPGETTTFTITAALAAELYGIELHLAFNPDVITIVDMDNGEPGVQVLPGSVLDINQGFQVANQVDNETGELLYAFTLLAPAAPATGEGDLLTFEVEALVTGSTDLTLTTVILASPEGEAIPVAIQHGQLIVSENGVTVVPTSTPDQMTTLTPTPTAVGNTTEPASTNMPANAETSTLPTPVPVTAANHTPIVTFDATATLDVTSVNNTIISQTPDATQIQEVGMLTTTMVAASSDNAAVSALSPDPTSQMATNQSAIGHEEGGSEVQTPDGFGGGVIVNTREFTAMGQQDDVTAVPTRVFNQSERSASTNNVLIVVILLGVCLGLGMIVIRFVTTRGS